MATRTANFGVGRREAHDAGPFYAQYDFLFLHGHPDHVARDTVFMGTAFSAPATMLVAQAVATARL